ncbi:hypothetical protein K435DRAFT_864538 [Dendrothele bispora CBS 962.96]|uniref:Uncharacterized protein n=1 Tax=Dendrothele bispora (strain CBS 962.96) TaxID=1314807 RepID=A0A4S8LLP3_DENBC|nr:hypothetical protein K435DRAFT_864538 [Dendrothele bispora CBS 962.96]
MSQLSVENYSTPADLEAIRAHSDKEIDAGHWLEALPEDFHLLPGMKVSPMFVVWQKGNLGKPHVITDHTGSGLKLMLGSLKRKEKALDMKAESKGKECFWRPLNTTDTPATI